MSEPRYDPKNTVLVPVTLDQLDDLAHGRDITIKAPVDGVVEFGAFGGRLWTNQWYMHGNGWSQKLIGRPRFEHRTLKCRDHSFEHKPKEKES